MKRYLTEFVGTFFLVLTIALTAASGTPFAPLAIGSALMVMVYMGGHISGGHYNPAVSIAAVLRKVLPAGDLVPYWLAQLAGAITAWLIAVWLADVPGAPAPAAEAGFARAFAIELLFTFALVLVVLDTATDPATEGNSYYGLAIGFTVAAGAWAGGPISGGAFNPAVGVGPLIATGFAEPDAFGRLLLYIAGPVAGALLAFAAYSVQHQVQPRPAEPAPSALSTMPAD